MKTLADLECADFASYQNQIFHFKTLSGEPFELVLDELTEYKYPSKKFEAMGKRRPFSLIFHEAKLNVQPQHMYELDHDDFGHLEIFLVPVGQDPDAPATFYQATFG